MLATALGAMVADAFVRFEFRVRLGSGRLAFAAAGIGGYLALCNGLEWIDTAVMGGAFALALAAALLVNRLPGRVPGRILGNADVVFWFVRWSP